MVLMARTIFSSALLTTVRPILESKGTTLRAGGKDLMEEVLDAVEKFTLIDKVGGGRNQNT
jgi:hypothetical protein